ncbi:MAG: DUF4402 domain-containing protein [Fusobacteriaceae bacterium]
MKKMLLVLSLVAVSTAYSATNQLLKATLTVVDPASEVILTTNTRAMQFGTVPIVNGGNASTNDVTLKISGNNAKSAKMSFPDKGTLTVKGGKETVDILYITSNIVEGALTNTGGVQTITSKGNLGDGTTGNTMSTDLKATMALNGKEAAGLYEGTVTIDAQYN